jgi:hypothetical protein
MNTFNQQEITTLKTILQEFAKYTKKHNSFLGHHLFLELLHTNEKELSIKWKEWYYMENRPVFDQDITDLVHQIAGNPDCLFSDTETDTIKECLKEELKNPNGYYNASAADYVRTRIYNKGYISLSENWMNWYLKWSLGGKTQKLTRGVNPEIIELLNQTGEMVPMPAWATYGT